MSKEQNSLDLDQIIFNLEQIDDQLTNLLSLSEELEDISFKLNKFVVEQEDSL